MKLIELRPYGLPSFDEAVPQGQPTVETPLQQSAPTHYVITQRYMQLVEAYKKPAENARMPREILPSLGVVAYHCYDGPRTPVNGSQIITFDRVWATVPSTFEDQEILTIPAQTPSAASVRNCSTYYSSYTVYRKTNLGIVAGGQNVTYNGKTQRDFFLIGSGGTYANTGLIPPRDEDIYEYKDWTALPVNIELSLDEWNARVSAMQLQSVKRFSGVISFPYEGAWSTQYGSTLCLEYMGGSSFQSGSYVSGQSKIVRYIGNIWERRSVNLTVP